MAIRFFVRTNFGHNFHGRRSIKIVRETVKKVHAAHEYGRNVCPRKTAHAQTEYQDNSTSGQSL